jgi:hypothetical protein
VTPPTATDAAARLREHFAVEATVDGPLASVSVPVEQWQAVGGVARESHGWLYLFFITAVEW